MNLQDVRSDLKKGAKHLGIWIAFRSPYWYGTLITRTLLGGSWDLVSKVIGTLIGVISMVTLIITLVTKSHDPLGRRDPNLENYPYGSCICGDQKT